jgi:hypothetical protein
LKHSGKIDLPLTFPVEDQGTKLKYVEAQAWASEISSQAQALIMAVEWARFSRLRASSPTQHYISGVMQGNKSFPWNFGQGFGNGTILCI